MSHTSVRAGQVTILLLCSLTLTWATQQRAWTWPLASPWPLW